MSSPTDYQAFFSYAHEDNDRQHGRVLRLAQAIKDEFAVTTGDDLELFLDSESLSWGDIWRDRINLALGQVPFFIAIVTPKYVKSLECRRELLAFSREAKSRNIGRLLLPILYIDVKSLSETSDDEVLAIIARTQYVDWRDLRLREPTDPDVLHAIGALASKMESLLEEVSATTQQLEARSDAQQFDNINDILEKIREKLGLWMESVEFDHVSGRIWESTVKERVRRINRLYQSRQHGGPVLAVYKRLGAELLPIAADRLEKAKNYARLTIDLDPLVTAALHYVEERPELGYMLDELSDGVHEAELNIEPPVGYDSNSYGIPPEAMRYSNSAAEADRLLSSGLIYTNEGNEIVLRWRDKLAAIKAGPADTVDGGLDALAEARGDDVSVETTERELCNQPADTPGDSREGSQS